MVDKLGIARIVLVRVQPAPGDAAGHKQHAAQPDPAFPGTLLLPEQILCRRDKSGGEQRQCPPLIAQIEICQHIQSERQQLLSPVCGKRRLFGTSASCAHSGVSGGRGNSLILWSSIGNLLLIVHKFQQVARLAAEFMAQGHERGKRMALALLF